MIFVFAHVILRDKTIQNVALRLSFVGLSAFGTIFLCARHRLLAFKVVLNFKSSFKSSYKST